MIRENDEELKCDIYSRKVINEIKKVVAVLGLIHMMYLFIFIYFEVYILATINVFSILVYLIVWLNFSKKNFNICLQVIFGEVISHIILCGLIIGEGTGFSTFCLVLLIGIRTARYFYNRINGIIINTANYTIIASVAYIAFSLSGSYYTPMYHSINQQLIEILDTLNSIIVILALNYYGFFSAKAILIYEKELNEKNKLLQEMSYIDPLTLLYNRRAIKMYINSYEEKRKDFAIILCDIDDFKSINDKYGHECGDMILREIATTINSLVEGKGYAARWGGEEILILNDNNNIDAYILGEQIRKTVEEASFVYGNNSISITITVGLGYDKEISSREAILKADKNLYLGKQRGKNIVIK